LSFSVIMNEDYTLKGRKRKLGGSGWNRRRWFWWNKKATPASPSSSANNRY
jgi:hypothetical protein